jgi:hypothetical protein
MEKKYYLPISSTSLAHYFGCACIKPSKYFENKQKDLQDKFSDFLLVTTNFGTQQTDCCLELVFTKQEADDLIDITKGFYLYEKPLPITRVRKIFFTSEERKQTITNINMSTAFVPDELVEVVKKEFDNIPMDKLEVPKDIANPSSEEQIKQFDKYLGGLALMRLAGEDYMNYSENYFATLPLFNSAIQRDLESSKIKINTGYSYRGVFTNDEKWQKIIPYLNKTIDENDIISIAQEENQTIHKDKITRIIDLNSLEKWTYTVAVLNTYGVGNESKKKKIDELILSNFKSDIKSGKSEGIALCFGINRGYSAFSNKYSLGKNEKVVKFQLNSQLDYYTIESLYQYVFNNNVKSDEFTYLKDWCPKQKRAKTSRKTDYEILDVIVIGKKKAKVLSKEYWQNLLPFFLQSNKFSEKTLPQIYQELGETVFNDTKDEIADDYENQIAQKQAEINQLKTNANNLERQVSQKQQEIEKLKSESKSDQDESKPAEVVQSIPTKEEVTNQTAEQQSANTTETDVKRIVEETLKYKEKNQTMLKKEAENRGIHLPKGIKQDDIIVLLMTTPDSRLKLE